jgi:hypothetical protein
MFQKITNQLLIITGAVFVSLAFYSPSQAADCGGSVPCACGDNVVANRTLVAGVDPIVGDVCAGNGLVMNTPGVVLDLNGNALRGSGNGAGVLIDGVNDVTIESGLIFKFDFGISTGSNTTTGSTISGTKPDGNLTDGIFLRGDGNELIAILSKRNGNNGVTVIGDGNTLSGHNDEYNGFDGIHVEGDGNELVSNLASENRKKGPGAGIMLIGNNNRLELNRITKMNTWGIKIQGGQNQLIRNQVVKQDTDGITVDGADNVLTDNKSNENRGVGVIVVGAGNPGDSTGNVVKGNRKAPQCSIYGVTTSPTCIQR